MFSRVFVQTHYFYLLYKIINIVFLQHLFPDAEQDAEEIEAKQQEVHESRNSGYDKLQDILQVSQLDLFLLGLNK